MAAVLTVALLTALGGTNASADEGQPPPWLPPQLESPPGMPAPPTPPAAPQEPPPPDGGAIVNGPPRVEAVPIEWFAQPLGRTVRIYVAGGYCRGEPKPVIDQIVVHEHRRPGRDKLAAVIRVFLERPAPLETNPRPRLRAGEGPASVVVCAGVEHSLTPRVSFARPADELVFYDGSEAPPVRIPARQR